MNRVELINWIKAEYRNVADNDIIEVSDEELEFYCSPRNDIDFCVVLGNVETRYGPREWDNPPTYYAYLRLQPGAVVRRDYYSQHARRVLVTFYIRPEAHREVYYVHRPTYMGRVEPPQYWRIEAVSAGSQRDRMLASGRTQNDAGEWVELPGEWHRFMTRAEAEAWMGAEVSRWEEGA